MWLLCWQTAKKKRQWQMLLNAPLTLLTPLWTIFKVFPDLKPDCKATSQRNWVKYFIITTCQPRSSAADPRSARHFQHRWNSSGGGAATRALGPVTSSFMGAAKQHHRGFSTEYQRRPSTARKMLARLLLTLCAICIQSGNFVFFFLPSCCLPQQIWEAAGNQENYFSLVIKEVLRL